MAEVRLEGVCKKYGKVEAVKNLDIRIKDKEFFSLLGPSGCGKSSTLRMIAGLEKITEGIIRIGDRIVNNVEPKDRNVAMVFENYALYPHMTVYENLSYPLRIRKVPQSEIEKGVKHAAEALQISELLGRRPRQLSGGQQQRVGVGRAIVRNPQVFLMDEPISHLDAKLRTLMRAELKRLQKDLDTTTIYVTHDQLEAISMADRIAIMNFGVLQQVGTPDEIFNKPANIFVAGFVGDPPMYFFDCETIDKAGEVFLRGDGFEVKTSDPVSSKLKSLTSKSLVMGIRPGDFIPRRKPSKKNNLIKSEVVVTEPLGDELILNVKVGEVMAKVKTDIDFRAEMGDKVWLQIDYRRFHIFDKGTGRVV